MLRKESVPSWKIDVDRYITDKSSRNFDITTILDTKTTLKDFERSLKKSLIASFQAIKSALELRIIQTNEQFKQAESNLKPALESVSKQAWSLFEKFFEQLKEVSVENSKTTLKKVHDLLFKELGLITSQIAEDSLEDMKKLQQHNITLVRLLDVTNSQILSFVTNEMKTLDINLNTLRDALVDKVKVMGLDKKLNVEFLILNFQIAKTNSKALKDLGDIFSKRKSLSHEQLNQVINKISGDQSKVFDYIVQRCKSMETLSRTCLQWAYTHPETDILPIFVQKQTESDLTTDQNAQISAQTPTAVSTTTVSEFEDITDIETSQELATEEIASIPLITSSTTTTTSTTSTTITTTTTTTSQTTTTTTPIVIVTQPTTKTSSDLLNEEIQLEETVSKDNEEFVTKLGFKGVKNLDQDLEIGNELAKVDENSNFIKKVPFNFLNYEQAQSEYDAERSVKRLKLAVEDSLQDLRPNFYLSEGYICIKLSPNALREIQGL